MTPTHQLFLRAKKHQLQQASWLQKLPFKKGELFVSPQLISEGPKTVSVIEPSYVHPNDVSIYHQARLDAEEILSVQETLLPGIWHIGNHSLKQAIQFQLQFKLAYEDLPFCYGYRQQKFSNRPCNVVGSYLLPKQLQAHLGGSSFLPILDSKWRTRQWQKRYQKWLNAQSELPPVSEDYPPVDVLVLLPHPGHLQQLEPFITSLLEQNASVLVVSTKPGIPVKSLCQKAFPDQPLLSWLPYEATHFQIEKKITYPTQILGQLAVFPAMKRKWENAFVLNQLPLWQATVEEWIWLEKIISFIQPKLVLGCLEYTPFAPILSTLRESYHFEWWNVQHGLLSPSHTFDLLSFDHYFAWNEDSRKRIEIENCPTSQNVKVVGNPKWDALAQGKVQNTSPTETLETLKHWKGNDPLIGVFPQMIQGFSSLSSKQCLFDVLETYLGINPTVKLLIKKHPLETDPLAEAYFTDHPRVKIYSHHQLTLPDALQLSDVVCSVFSATLYEAAVLNKPIVAVDFEGVLDREAIGIQSIAHIITDAKNIENTLGTALKAVGDQEKRMIFEELIPSFNQSFIDRIQKDCILPSLQKQTAQNGQSII